MSYRALLSPILVRYRLFFLAEPLRFAAPFVVPRAAFVVPRAALARVALPPRRACVRAPRLPARLAGSAVFRPLRAAAFRVPCLRAPDPAACFRRRRGASPSVTDSRLTGLLKLLCCPLAVVSCTSSARLLSSKDLNHSSHEMGWRLSRPAKPGKSSRIIPGSPLPPVRRTHAGCAFRASAHCRMLS